MPRLQKHHRQIGADLEALGFVRDRHAAGGHVAWTHPCGVRVWVSGSPQNAEQCRRKALQQARRRLAAAGIPRSGDANRGADG